jgi:hypothetical protein
MKVNIFRGIKVRCNAESTSINENGLQIMLRRESGFSKFINTQLYIYESNRIKNTTKFCLGIEDWIDCL